jgi:spermidine synthase
VFRPDLPIPERVELLKVKFGKLLYSKNYIQVWQNLGYRWLTFGNDTLQTLINRYQPEVPQLFYMKFIVELIQARPGETCLLGLGGGGLVHSLSNYLRSYALTAVEFDEEVIAVAQQYFDLEKYNFLRVICSDAAQFIYHSQELYSYIIIDLFDANSFPSNCKNEAFISACKKSLSMDGILIINLPNSGDQWQVYNLVKKVFAQSTLIVVLKKSNNILILANRHFPVIEILGKFTQKKWYHTIAWDPLWGYRCTY